LLVFSCSIGGSIHGTAVGLPGLVVDAACNSGDMPLQSLFAVLMLGVSLVDLLQTVPHEELVVACGEQCGRDVDEDRNPGVAVGICEGLLPEKDGGHDTCAEISGQIGGKRVAGEPPDHDRVSDADGERHTLGADERIGGIQARPDHDSDVAVHEEFLEEEVALVVLICVGEGAENAGNAAVVDRRAMILDVKGLGRLDLGPVRGHEEHACHESPKYLSKDIVRHFPPWETLPDGKADGYSGVEMSTAHGSTGDDCEGDANGKSPTDLEKGSKDVDPDHGRCRVRRGKGKRRHRGYASEDVEKHASRFGHHFTQNAGSLVLKVELPLTDRFGWNDMPGDVALQSFSVTELDVVGMLSDHLLRVAVLSRHDDVILFAVDR